MRTPAPLLDAVDAHAEALRENEGRALGSATDNLSVYLAEAVRHGDFYLSASGSAPCVTSNPVQFTYTGLRPAMYATP